MEHWETYVKGDQRRYNKPGERQTTLTEKVNLFVSKRMKKAMTQLIEEKLFPSYSEFVRHLIMEYFEKHKEFLRLSE
jgi:hypothetical protein